MTDHADLRRQVVQALADDIGARGGLTPGAKSRVAARFIGLGASRSTIFAWLAAAVDEGQAGRAAIETLRRAGKVASDPVRAIENMVPRPPEAPGGIRIVEAFNTLLADIERARAKAFGSDGEVRNTRLLLAAADAMRKNLEAAVRVQTGLAELGALEKFHQAIMAELRAESPDLAERVARRLALLADLQLGQAA